MKIVFVVGGGYKWFYLNKLKTLYKIDLLVFNQGIFYDFDYSKEIGNTGIVSQELLELNQKLKCPIVVYGNVNRNGLINKCYILCSNNKINVIDYNKDMYLYIKGKLILIGSRIYNFSRAFAVILFADKRVEYKKFTQIRHNNYFLCDKRSVLYKKRGKFYRKFRKCCNFTLKIF